jgi:uncharacterized protein (DUF849 family)
VDKLIINAALTGMVPTRRDSPHVPLRVEEIVADARRCCDAGASIVHLHARDDDGEPTYCADVYGRIIAGVRAACPDLIVCVSTSGRRHRELWQRGQVLRLPPPLRPEMASLTLGSMNFPSEASLNPPSIIEGLARTMNENRIVPELEVFDLGMVDYGRYLIDKGHLRPPFYCNILLGSRGTLAATPLNLALVAQALPHGTTWAAAGIGRFQFSTNLLAIAMGGHVRVGLEDNLHFDAARTRLATNAELIDRLAGVARAMGREIATATEARAVIGLRGERASQAA